MKKQELDRLLADAGKVPDSGPIETHLHALATEWRLPHVALAMCTIRFEEAAPALRAMLSRAADGEALSDDDATLFFRGLHIMGGARDAAAFQTLLRFLHRPIDEIEYLLGDGVTQSLGKIVAGMFDGDVDSLFRAIANRSLGEYVRTAFLEAATFLTWDQRIERDRLRGLLIRFCEERMADDDDYAWVGWTNAISLLGFRDLAPLVHRAWDEGHIPDFAQERSDFENDLREAERKPDDLDRLKDANLGYIEDVLEALEWTDHDEPPPEDREEIPYWDRSESYPGLPVTNPWRDVGRNDPCPCGSGKKAKKCCLPH